eukprot:1195302-Prorocentrum_minimum.AAC.1
MVARLLRLRRVYSAWTGNVSRGGGKAPGALSPSAAAATRFLPVAPKRVQCWIEIPEGEHSEKVKP